MLNTIIIVVAFISLIIQLNGISEAFTNRPKSFTMTDAYPQIKHSTIHPGLLLCTGPGEATQIN